jgi:hypothetical protein
MSPKDFDYTSFKKEQTANFVSVDFHFSMALFLDGKIIRWWN